MSNCIKLKWRDEIARGYMDEFPVADFTRETRGALLVHSVLGPRGGIHHARCWLTVKDLRARLDYRKHRAFNLRHHMDVGLLEFAFEDRRRTRVKTVSWKGRFQDPTEVVVTSGPCEALAREVEDIARRYAQYRRLLRPRQLALYRELVRTYGGQCAISKCAVLSSLEAAHLRSVASSGSDSATNALLLRADIHALLDTGHMAINPRTRIVYFSAEAREWSEYRGMHDKRKLSQPQAGFLGNAPSATALKKPWEEFMAQHRGELCEGKRRTQSRT